MGKTISENDRWHHYLKGKAREKRQSKKTNPLLLNDFGKMGLSAVWLTERLAFFYILRYRYPSHLDSHLLSSFPINNADVSFLSDNCRC
ncbi:hypothetical protein QRO24_01350 [Gallibacterium anatis]|uniref:hypothetical protein n=1 Tax=Gallibacterium anatis TaxID=750 RepID=UPI0038D4AA0B